MATMSRPDPDVVRDRWYLGDSLPCTPRCFIIGPRIAYTKGRSADIKGRSAGTTGRSAGTKGGPPAGTKGRSAGTQGRSTDTKGRSADIEGRSAGTKGRSVGTKGRSADTKGRTRCPRICEMWDSVARRAQVPLGRDHIWVGPNWKSTRRQPTVVRVLSARGYVAWMLFRSTLITLDPTPKCCSQLLMTRTKKPFVQGVLIVERENYTARETILFIASPFGRN